MHISVNTALPQGVGSMINTTFFNPKWRSLRAAQTLHVNTWSQVISTSSRVAFQLLLVLIPSVRAFVSCAGRRGGYVALQTPRQWLRHNVIRRGNICWPDRAYVLVSETTSTYETRRRGTPPPNCTGSRDTS